MATKKTGKKTTTKAAKPQARQTVKTKSQTSDESDGSDGRTGSRVPIQLLVDYRADGHYLFDFCRDLGTGGVFIQTKKPLPQGSPIDLTFTIPDSKETLTAKGKVIWVQGQVEGRAEQGMGVQFTGFSGEQRKMLEDFVVRYHGEKLGPRLADDKKRAV